MAPLEALKASPPPRIVLRDASGWLHFGPPHLIITATRVADVVPALNEVERLVESHGWHAAGFLSYEASPAFDSAFRVRASAVPQPCPLLWFALCDAPSISESISPPAGCAHPAALAAYDGSHCVRPSHP